MVLKLRLYCKSAGRQGFNLDPDFLFRMFPKSILQRSDRHSFLPYIMELKEGRVKTTMCVKA